MAALPTLVGAAVPPLAVGVFRLYGVDPPFPAAGLALPGGVIGWVAGGWAYPPATAPRVGVAAAPPGGQVGDRGDGRRSGRGRGGAGVGGCPRPAGGGGAGGGRGRPVVVVSLAGTAVADADLADLGGLSRVTALDLSRTRVTGRGLGDVLRAMPALKTLDLSHTPLTDEGLLGLDAHPALTELGLAGTAVTDAAIGRSPLTRDPKVKPLARPGQPGK